MVGSVKVEPGRRRRRRREDSEQEILEAAERLLRERPFRELTVDDLMAATSQSRTAFYRHFTDRQDLLVHLIRDLNEELWEMSAGWLRGSGDPLAEGRESPRPGSAATPPPAGPAWPIPTTWPPPWSG